MSENKQRILVLATDYAGTVSNFGKESASTILDLKSKIEKRLNLKVVWVIISGTYDSSMRNYVKRMNKTLLECNPSENSQENAFIELGFSYYGSIVFSEKYDIQELSDLKLEPNKSLCLQDVVEFYGSGNNELCGFFYAGDAKNDFEVFEYIQKLQNSHKYEIKPESFAPGNASDEIKKMATYEAVEYAVGIYGVMYCIQKWLEDIDNKK